MKATARRPRASITITPGLMNPNSNYYLAINIGFPNAYDKANDRSGAFLMIHGDCSSRGCYAMTDEQIGEIYSLARESFLGGQQSFQIQAYPFRMTPANFAHHRTNPNMPFWKMIKEGNDHFEVTHLEPKVDVCDRHYVFDAQPPPAKSGKPLVFNADRPLPGLRSRPGNRRTGAGQAAKRRSPVCPAGPEIMPPAPIRTGLDGGMNRVFLAQAQRQHTRRRGCPPPTGLPAATRRPSTADNGGRSTFAGRLFGGLFGIEARRADESRFDRVRIAWCADRAARSRPRPARHTEAASAAHSQTAAAASRNRRPNAPTQAASCARASADCCGEAETRLRNRKPTPQRRRRNRSSTARSRSCRPAASTAAGADSSNQPTEVGRQRTEPVRSSSVIRCRSSVTRIFRGSA